PILTVSKLVTADGKPAIFCIDYVAFSTIRNFNYSREDLTLPIFHFLQKFCDTDVVMDLTVVKPILTDTFLSDMLQIKEGTPIILMEEQAYNIDNQVVMFCEEYYAYNFFQQTVLRKKI
ncbi:MAG: UTRA domain-containing protein, partial [Clostridiaceae bacterium]|nr:UTRA domain-containing protein [Clostridiaceae bacterium]